MENKRSIEHRGVRLNKSLQAEISEAVIKCI